MDSIKIIKFSIRSMCTHKAKKSKFLVCFLSLFVLVRLEMMDLADKSNFFLS